jgi:hypothetical protein
MVTGANKFFSLTDEEVKRHELPTSDLLPISPPGSRHFRSLAFSRVQWNREARAGARVYLFRPLGEHPSPPARKYIAIGEEAGLHTRFKCRNRKPWWQVPLVRTPDYFLTYMNGLAPRIIANRAGVGYLNSVHGFVVARQARSLANLLPVLFLNSASLLSAELVGRSYGGGILKLEPREAELLLVPSEATAEQAREAVISIASDVDVLLQQGDLDDAVARVDEAFLHGVVGLAADAIDALREGHAFLRGRRMSRRRSSGDLVVVDG